MANQALRNQMTRTVRVSRTKLLETLRANRARHLQDYAEAMAGYKAMALAKVEETFAGIHARIDQQKGKIVAHIETFSHETADKFGDYLTILNGESISLKVPQSYADAYSAAIDMAEFDVREELELSGAEFQCFCRDVWDWSHEFEVTNSTYKMK